MISRHLTVWIDHHEARILHVSPEGFDESTVPAPLHHVHRHPKRSDGEANHPDDEHRFFHEVTLALADSDEVLVLGPSTAKLHFVRYAQQHAPAVAGAIVGVETVDHPTGPQIAAYARHYFRAFDRVRGDSPR